jgi:hypothetical protein
MVGSAANLRFGSTYRFARLSGNGCYVREAAGWSRRLAVIAGSWPAQFGSYHEKRTQEFEMRAPRLT